MDPEHPKITKSLRSSVVDGAYDAAKVGFGESFFSAFALFLGASPFQIALLGSLPQAIGAIAQIFSETLVRVFRTRKKLIITGATIQLLIFFPLLATVFLGKLAVPMAIALVVIYFTSGLIVEPIWNSWMADLVSDNKRGAYFGKRNKVIGLSTLAAFIIAGIILAVTKEYATALAGFVVLFFLAFIARSLSVRYLTKQHDPTLDMRKLKRTSLKEFFTDVGSSDFGKVMFYLVSTHFFVFLAGPFFAVFMLNYLQMPYWQYAVVIGSSFIAKSFSMPVWGRAADRFGSRRVLVLAGSIVGFVPLLWLVSSQLWWLVFVNIFGGLVWAGLDIASSNSLFERTTPSRRTGYLAYFNMCQGLAVFAGALVGSAIVTFGSWPTTVFYLVFLVSGIGRFLSAIIFLPLIREARSVVPIGYRDLLMHVVTSSNPTNGLVASLPMHQERIKESKLWTLFFDRERYSAIRRVERARNRRRKWNEKHLRRKKPLLRLKRAF